MRRWLAPVLFLVGSASLPVAAGARPNVLLICVDDLRPELGCCGAEHIRSPNIDRLASRGRLFRRHYVQAPTCGASRAAFLTGRYGGHGNQALFQRVAAMRVDPASVPPSLPAWFRRHGYTTAAVGKVSHHPGGMGGERWDDPSILEMPDSWDRNLLPAGPWRDPRGWMHGLADGETRIDPVGSEPGEPMAIMQTRDGPDTRYPDGVVIETALRQIDELASESKPFFLAVGLLRPHLPFGAPARFLEPYQNAPFPPVSHPDKPVGRTTWSRSSEFMRYDRGGRDPRSDPEFAIEVRKHYAACVSFADSLVGQLLDRLDDAGAADSTIVVLWGDHGWHLGEHAVWGKHTLFEESLRSPLIVSAPGMARRGAPTDAMVQSVDVFPTLCELARIEAPAFVDGVSLGPLLRDPDGAGRPAVGYFRGATTLRSETHRLIRHQDGYLELYDHRSSAGETENLAEKIPLEVARMAEQLAAELESSEKRSEAWAGRTAASR